ncbi:cell division protein FtsA [Aestuariivirga sp.]|uniref:cell division protein FtsA n=1 Tax=Aestuariivirga sp. TaxID=2650926 RepID=UPI0039E560BA
MTVVQLHTKTGAKNNAPAKGTVVAALDIGSTKISCLIAEVNPPKHRTGDAEERNVLRVLGVGHQASRGVRCGAVVNVDEAERAIRMTVDQAERMADHTISEVLVSVSGGRPLSRIHAAAIQTVTGQVGPNDMRAVLDTVLADVDPGRRTILHLSPIQYHLDDAKGVHAPLGMFGTTLGLELGVVTVEPAHLQNLSLAIERAHLGTAGFVVSPYAAAKAVLADDEMTLGTIVIDMGGATTSFAIFHDGALAFSDVVPLGGQHITNDIARGLSTTIAHAERMKTMWGSAQALQADEREMIAVPLLGERGVDTVQKVPKSMLTNIIRPRLEEIFEHVRSRIDAAPAAHLAGHRVVLTGGASLLTGMREVAMHLLGRQVRMGLPAHLQGMPESAHTPGFAVAAGLLNHALKPDVHYALPQHKARQLSDAQHGYMRKMGRWIADSF